MFRGKNLTELCLWKTRCRMVRTLDVKAAQVHMRRTTGTPFVAAHSEVNGVFYSADENALIALHKMRTRMGSAVEIEASKGLVALAGFDRAL
jgi:hypothetical protein